MILSYKIHTVTPYINWIYFFHAWGFQPRFAAIANIHGCDACRASWLTTFPEEERSKASEAMQLFKEANRMLDLLDRDYEVKTLFKLCKANSDGDNLIIEKEKDQFVTFPLLRQQTPKRDGSPFLCLSDFIRPLSSGIPDTIGAFASSIEVKFSLCKFSSNAICIISSSEKSLTIAGIVCIPANLDALNLLSPAIIS